MIKPNDDSMNPFGPSRRRRLFVLAGAVGLAIPVLALASPVTVPHQFADGEVVSAQDFNDNFEAIASAINDNDARIGMVEAAVPQITIRKATGSSERAIAFCADDEVLTGGGCFMPPENLYDVDHADYATYHTGNYPRPMVGMTSVPVAPGTTLGDLRPTTPTGNIMPFPGDVIEADSGSVVAAPGGGWGCRAGVIQHNDGPGSQAITTNLYENWYFHVKAYAVCMKA